MNDTATYTSRVKLDGFNPTGFDRGASKMKEILWYLVKVVFFLTALPYPNSIKVALLRLFGAKVGKGIIIKPRVNIHFPWKLHMGNNIWIGEEAFILNFEQVFIGNNVCISQRAFLCGGNHDYRDSAMPYRNGPITLKDGVWIGACCFIGPNVCIETDTVVSAASVVTCNLDANGIYKGNPATYFKTRWKNN